MGPVFDLGVGVVIFVCLFVCLQYGLGRDRDESVDLYSISFGCILLGRTRSVFMNDNVTAVSVLFGGRSTSNAKTPTRRVRLDTGCTRNWKQAPVLNNFFSLCLMAYA